MFSAAIKSGAAGSPKDPQFNYVTMLLHGDGTNGAQNNTFLDSSTNNYSVSRTGNTTQGTWSAYGSNWSNYFTGANSLSFATNAAFSLNSSSFTIEAWVCLDSVSGDRAVTSTYGNGSTGWSLQFSAGILYFYRAGDTVGITATTAISAGVWYHLAVSGTAGSSIKMFINGVQQGSTLTGNITDSSTALSVGQLANVNYLAGYVSNLRIVKGTALYLANFTPPTSPLTAITNTSLLTCQSNRFIDSSANAFTCLLNGSPSVQRFSPFAPSIGYTTTAIGGSVYLDGSDYLQVSSTPFDFSGGADFTLEFFMYIPAGVSYGFIYQNYSTSPGITGQAINAGTDFVGFESWAGGDQSPAFALSGTTIQNQWNHVALVRSGSGTNNMSLYINGSRVQQGTYTSFTAPAQANTYIGVRNYLGLKNYLTGYISGFRIVKGTGAAIYSGATYTVPTAPPTPITNTQLLLNYTNAGIFDNAMMNNLETVGNAQISTSVKKFGTGSMSFDGTTDRLFVPNATVNQFGTGDYTIEFWVYANSWATTPVLLEYGRPNSSASPSIEFYISTTGGKLDVYGGATIGTLLVSYSSIPTTTWTYVALTRSSGTTRLFINGTQSGSSVTDTTNYTQATINIGAFVDGNYCLNGYIDDFRVTKGVARYTANFTPPTAAFPNN